MPTAQPKQDNQFQVKTLIFTIIAILLLLSVNNIISLTEDKQPSPTKTVLGVTTFAGDITYWKSLISSNPDYFPAYIQLARLYYQEKNFTQAKLNFNQAKLIDPNNASVINFRFED